MPFSFSPLERKMFTMKKYCFVIFGFILLPTIITGEIEIDYFFGEASLRSPKGLQCTSDELIRQCTQECGRHNYGCLFGDCVCLDRNLDDKSNRKSENLPESIDEIIMMISDFEDLIEVARKYISDATRLEDDKEEHPALRHHIAHFCPNLELARKCIRTCMQVGKPAFCGKDHNCYCGHKYSEHDTNKEVDVNDVYAQFRDLYTKYFGPEGGTPVEL